MSDVARILSIRDGVIAALATITCIRQIDSFGSVGANKFDLYSDLDLIATCDNLQPTAWLAAAAIRSAMPVAYYRMFTGVAQPSGRYWFHDESPFHRLDISFVTPAEQITIRQDGIRPGHPIMLKSEYTAQHPSNPQRDRAQFSPAAPLEITPHETEIGRLLYVYLETAKAHYRHQSKPNLIQDARAWLLVAAAQMHLPTADQDLRGYITLADEFIQSGPI